MAQSLQTSIVPLATPDPQKACARSFCGGEDTAEVSSFLEPETYVLSSCVSLSTGPELAT